MDKSSLNDRLFWITRSSFKQSILLQSRRKKDANKTHLMMLNGEANKFPSLPSSFLLFVYYYLLFKYRAPASIGCIAVLFRLFISIIFKQKILNSIYTNWRDCLSTFVKESLDKLTVCRSRKESQHFCRNFWTTIISNKS